MKKGFKTIFNLSFHLIVLVGLGWLIWPFVSQAIQMPKLTGYDAEQFIHMANYFRQSPGLPWAGWDHLGYEGVPRLLDTAFTHYYLIQPLVAKLGLNIATKVYPLIWLGVFFLFSYLTLFRLSKSRLISLALTAGLVNSLGVYVQIYEYGVVLSALAQAVFPLLLFFLVLFGQTKNKRYLMLAAVALAWQFYSHGAMALVFGFIPAMLFLFFCRFEKEKWLNGERLRRILGFGLVTLAVGALGILPQVADAFKGGTYGRFPKAQVEAQAEIFQMLLEMTNLGLLVAFGLAVLVGILFFKKHKSNNLILPLMVLLGYFLIFQVATMFGVNPIGGLLFPGRSFWYFGLLLAVVAAVLLSPLVFKGKGRWWRWLIGLIISGVIGWVVLGNRLEIDRLLPLSNKTWLGKAEQDETLVDLYKTSLTGIWDEVDQDDTNVRVWLHAFPKIYWSIVSLVPQAEGYFHFYTKYSADRSAWLFATLAEETVENQTIPQDMADKQGQFLIDWYGVKYLLPFPGSEFNLAPRFWEENEYILKRSAEDPPAVLTIKPEFTSGIIEAVKVPLVGFVGSDEGYDTFLRDLGMLNLNTHYLIPLRLAESVDDLKKQDLEKLDMLVVYNFKGKGRGWKRIAEFVKTGGSLFIETGGNALLREGIGMPEVFPMNELKFGDLGRDWQVEAGGGLVGIDFEKLEPLMFKDEPWKLSYVEERDWLRQGSEVWLSQAGRPVVVVSKLSKGKVVWSGLNSWYRPWEFKKNGMVEVEILEVLLKSLLTTNYQADVGVRIRRERAERIVVEGSDFTGVVVKENHLPGWQAWVKSEGKKQRLKIYSAGLDFMYVAIPEELRDKLVKVEFSYQGWWFYWLLFGVSAVALVVVIGEIVTNGKILKQLKGGILDPERYLKKIGGWWDKEEG